MKNTIFHQKQALLLLGISIALFFIYPITIASADDASHQYVMFLGGINTESHSGKRPIGGDFDVIEQYLRKNLGISNFVYFSYSVALQPPTQYCRGWDSLSSGAAPAPQPAPPPQPQVPQPGPPPQPQPVPTPIPRTCTASNDLTELSLNPIYSSNDTHIKTDQQAPVLEWLIGQIIKRDSEAEIHLVGHSLGGVVASYWGGSQIGSNSPYRSNIRSIVLINSPVGGFPFANVLQDCGSDRLCNVLKFFFNNNFGADILRQLQVSLPLENNGSITDTLSQVTNNFPVTSIQSSEDYFVNQKSLPTAANGLCQGSDQAPIGIGSQFWRNDKLLDKQQLGGKRLADEKVCFQDIPGFLGSNHNAALRDREGAQSPAQRTARLVYESITIPKIPTMSLISLPEFPTLKPGEKTDVEIVVQNTSDFAWPAEGRMKLVNIEGDTFSAATLEALQPIPSGAQVKWILSVTAPATPGAYHGFWQLTLDHYPFGERIPIVLAVVPQSSNAGFVDMIKTMLDDARQQLIDKVASTWEDLKRRIEERIQAEIEREIQRRINALCGTAPTGVIIAAGVVWWRRRRR